MPDGSERRRKREKIVNRDVAAAFRIGTDYQGPLTKSDAQRVLDLLIAQDVGTYTPPNGSATLAEVAREYLTLREPNWGPREVCVSRSIVQRHIAGGPLGDRPIADLSEAELQGWINGHVNANASKSHLKKLLRHTRAIFKLARKQNITSQDPTEDLRARSKVRTCERFLTADECRRLLSVVSGRDHLIVRMFIQLGLRAEELFALRRKDVSGNQLMVDEALVNGKSTILKTDASEGLVHIPPGLELELNAYMGVHGGDNEDWLFRTTHGRPGFLNQNNYRERILQPAAIKAGIGVTDTGKKDAKTRPILKTDVDFRCLRRTCATLFGAQAKDPKSVQAQLRHADPTVTLKHYQKSIPENVRAAGDQLERALGFTAPSAVPVSIGAVIPDHSESVLAIQNARSDRRRP